MSDEEAAIIRDSINEFSRLTRWMHSINDKEDAPYPSMYDRYMELKILLTALGVNITKLDIIKE